MFKLCDGEHIRTLSSNHRWEPPATARVNSEIYPLKLKFILLSTNNHDVRTTPVYKEKVLHPFGYNAF